MAGPGLRLDPVARPALRGRRLSPASPATVSKPKGSHLAPTDEAGFGPALNDPWHPRRAQRTTRGIAGPSGPTPNDQNDQDPECYDDIVLPRHADRRKLFLGVALLQNGDEIV